METVFYSWQAQLPNRTNRGFIESALEQAVKRSMRRRRDPNTRDLNILGFPGSADAALLLSCSRVRAGGLVPPRLYIARPPVETNALVCVLVNLHGASCNSRDQRGHRNLPVRS